MQYVLRQLLVSKPSTQTVGVSRRPLGRQDENQVVPVGFVEPGAPEAHLSEFSTELELIAGTVQFVAAFVV